MYVNLLIPKTTDYVLYSNMASNISKDNYWQSRKVYRVLKDERISLTKFFYQMALENWKTSIFNIAPLTCNQQFRKDLKMVGHFFNIALLTCNQQFRKDLKMVRHFCYITIVF